MQQTVKQLKVNRGCEKNLPFSSSSPFEMFFTKPFDIPGVVERLFCGFYSDYIACQEKKVILYPELKAN